MDEKKRKEDSKGGAAAATSFTSKSNKVEEGIPMDNINHISVQIENGKRTGDDRLIRQVTSRGRQNVHLTFHDICYEVETRLDDKPVCGKKGQKEILHSLSGVIPPGLNAIMGPTGSGKTSLLDVLAKRKDPRGLKKGVVLVDETPVGEDFRLMSGYVVQDDVVMGTLTVRENLAFSANLRLSSEAYSEEVKKQKVEDVIEQLGLQACANTLVGNEFVRGVSGGERKRVNIGMEMILDPPVLFLDEPTTGLDANTANSIILLLYKLAMGGRNIILSIHQPRYSIFALFDRLILLCKGEIIYMGEAKNSVQYLEGIGYTCPAFSNPADFFLDVVGGDVNTAQLIQQMNKEGTTDYEAISKVLDRDEKNDVSSELILAYKNSDLNKQESKRVTDVVSRVAGSHTVSTEVSYANGFFKQLKYLSKRTVLNILRNPMTSVVQIMVLVIFGVLIGIIYFQTDLSRTSGLQNRAGCFFFLVTSQIMSNLSALEVFIRNRKFFRHESASGYYRASVYFVSQVFADLIPNRVIPNTFFALIIYFMIGFQLQVDKFFIFLLTLILTAVSASAVAFMVSASVEVFAVANALVSIPYIFMMLFGGFLANVTSILDWLEWIKWFSIFRYGINALTVNEMSGLVFLDNRTIPGFDGKSCINTITHDLIPKCTTGEEYMDSQGIVYGAWGLWQNILALGAIAIGFLILTYIQLRRINKYK